MSAAVVARWDGFLAQIRERFLALMQEAIAGCPMLLEQSNFDAVPMGNALGAIEMRAKQLGTKVEETWSAQVEKAFEQADVPRPAIDAERKKGDALRDFMDFERERTRIAIWSDAGRKFYERAKADVGRSFACTSCTAPLDVPFTFRALNVPCTHCRTVNGFEPGTMMRMGEICIHPLCEEGSWSEWVAMTQADNARRRVRDVTIHHLKTWERAQIAYWRAYLGRRIQLMPDTAPAFEADLRGKMRSFYEQMDREGPWIQAGRPRDLV